MELFNEVATIINRNKGKEIEIKPQDRLREDLHIDSLDTIMIGCDLEDQFHVTIDPDEIKSLNVVRDIVEKLEMKISLSHPVNT